MIINLTPHEIVVRNSKGEFRYPPSGQVCRCQVEAVACQPVDDVDVVQSSFGVLSGLPEPAKDAIYLVSTPAAQAAALQGRTDVVSPDTGPTATRRDGQVVAVARFQRF